jgi:hypothetical protein
MDSVQNIDLNELGLIDDGDVPIDADNLPEERSTLPRETPQPGTLRLQVPAFDRSIIKPLPTDNGQRIKVDYRDSFALKLLPSGKPFSYGISGADRGVFDKGQRVGTSSELAYFLKATGFTGVLSSKSDYVKAIQQAAGKTFEANCTWSTSCNPKKQVYAEGGKQDRVGCGRRYALKAESYKKKDGTQVDILAIPRDASGAYKDKFDCMCGARLTAWPRLESFRAVSNGKH